MMTRIIVSKFGNVNRDEIKSILDIMSEAYARLQPHNVELVDVLFFENYSILQGFFSREKTLFKVSENLGNEFSAIHEAWRGLPRISLSMDRLSRQDESVLRGTVRHEVGHSVLHGSLEYYIFQTPSALVKLGTPYRFSAEYIRNILYLTAIAVKDFEVTDLLYDHGYHDDQIAYVKDLLKPSSNDLESWKLARGNRSAEVLCIAGRLKDLLCATPIMRSPRPKVELGKVAESGLSYFSPAISKRMIDVGLQLSRVMTGSTHRKVEIASEILCEKLFETILRNS